MRGVWIVVALGALAAIGFGVYQKWVAAPREARRATQAEIEQWYAKWKPARECLVGRTPHADNGYDAVVLREVIDGADREKLRECLGFFRRLARPGNSQSGERKIERGWLDLEKAVGRLANAHALRVDKSPSRSIDDLREKLGAALEEVDRIYTKLRTAAKMKPPLLGQKRKIPEVGKALVVSAGATAIPPSNTRLAGDAVLVQGAVDGVTTLAEIRGASKRDVVVSKIARGVIRAATKARWGVWQPPRRSTSLRSGEITVDGRPSGRGVLLMNAPAGQTLRGLYAFGSDDGSRRVVVVRQQDRRGRGVDVVLRSANGGRSWSKAAPVGTGKGTRSLHRFDWLQRRFEIIERQRNGVETWSAVTVAKDEVIRVPLTEQRTTRFSTHEGCFAANATWLINSSDAGRDLYVVSAAGTATRIGEAGAVAKFLACTDTHALARSAANAKFQISLCTSAGCSSSDRIPRPQGAKISGLFVGDEPVIGVTANDLIVLWKLPGVVHAVARFEDVPALRGLVLLGKTPHAVTDDEALRLIPLPGKW